MMFHNRAHWLGDLLESGQMFENDSWTITLHLIQWDVFVRCLVWKHIRCTCKMHVSMAHFPRIDISCTTWNYPPPFPNCHPNANQHEYVRSPLAIALSLSYCCAFMHSGVSVSLANDNLCLCEVSKRFMKFCRLATRHRVALRRRQREQHDILIILMTGGKLALWMMMHNTYMIYVCRKYIESKNNAIYLAFHSVRNLHLTH